MKKERVAFLAQKALGVGVVVSFLMAAFAIVGTNLVPGKYLLPAVLVPGIISGLLAFFIFKKKLPRRKNLLLLAASLLAVIANGVIYTTCNSTTTFFNTIQEKGYTYEEYSIVAKKDRHIDLTNGSNKITAQLANDTNYDLVKHEVGQRTKSAFKDYDELTSLTTALNEQTADTAAIKSSYVQLLKENNIPFYQSIEVLATFTIKIKNDSTVIKTDTTKPFILYVSGIDTYGAISTVARSDVNMLVVVNPRTHKILLINTPRDYYVQLHGTTGLKDKLTHAGIYGIDMSVTTLEDLYGVDISYYARVNFASLTSIVDALGTIDVYSDNAFSTERYSFTTGYNTLNGKQALEFSRERHSFEDGDRTRGRNQQKVIDAIIQRLSTPSTLTNYQNILKSLEGSFQTNMSPTDITGIMRQQMDTMQRWQIQSISVDGTGSMAPTYSMGNIPLYVMQPDQASVDAAKQKIRQYQ